eukprot:m.700691 g.700691  ORF g.700691 m.700691 type:complete len:285 (+) comp22910_c0_seq4:5131-5985(+)
MMQELSENDIEARAAAKFGNVDISAWKDNAQYHENIKRISANENAVCKCILEHINTANIVPVDAKAMLHGKRMKKLRLSHPWIHAGSPHFSCFATVSDRGAVEVELAHIRKYLADKAWFSRVGGDADTSNDTAYGGVRSREFHVSVKDDMEIYVKGHIRGKLINDQFRTCFVYAKASEAVAFVHMLFAEADILCCDVNFSNVSVPQMAKFYIGITPSVSSTVTSGVTYIPLEIEILSEASYKMLHGEEHKTGMHARYKVERLRRLKKPQQQLLARTVQKNNYLI